MRAAKLHPPRKHNRGDEEQHDAQVHGAANEGASIHASHDRGGIVEFDGDGLVLSGGTLEKAPLPVQRAEDRAPEGGRLRELPAKHARQNMD